MLSADSRCYATTIRIEYAECIASGKKKWEGRTQRQVYAKLTTMVTDRDTVCFLAGSVYIVWCEIEEVVTCGCTRKHVEIVVTPSTWREFAPWCTTHQKAVDLYVGMGDGSGYVFIKLKLPYRIRDQRRIE